MNIWLSIGSFFGLLILLILISAKVNGGFKIEMSWIALALTPSIIWLLAVGKLSEFSGFGVAFKLKEASGRSFSLSLEGDRIDFTKMEQQEKGGPDVIRQMIDRRTPALAFVLGKRGYYDNGATRYYLDQLLPHEFFKYVVFLDSAGKFKGLVDARELHAHFDELDFVRAIEEGNLNVIPGAMTRSVSQTSSKRDALKVMHEANVNELPVVDDHSELVGIVERNKLTSSIVMQLISDL